MTSARVKDKNDYLTVKQTPITAAGVFPYLGRSIGADEPDRIYHVYRPASALDNKETLDSARHIPIIEDHTMLGGDGSEHSDPNKVGVHGTTCENIVFDGKTLKSDIRLFSKSIANTINSGKNKISMGFRCAYKKASGTHEGQAYDYIQDNITFNHLAIVKNGRVPGALVLDHNDTGSVAFDSFDLEFTPQEPISMPEDNKVALDEAAIAAIVAKAVQTAMDEKEKADAEKAEAAKEKDKEDKAMDAAAMDSLKAELAEVKSSAFKAVMAEASQRDALVARVTPWTGAFDASEMTAADVASYALDKLEIEPVKGQEQAQLLGFLHGRDAPSATRAFALDASATSGDADLNAIFA